MEFFQSFPSIAERVIGVGKLSALQSRHFPFGGRTVKSQRPQIFLPEFSGRLQERNPARMNIQLQSIERFSITESFLTRFDLVVCLLPPPPPPPPPSPPSPPSPPYSFSLVLPGCFPLEIVEPALLDWLAKSRHVIYESAIGE